MPERYEFQKELDILHKDLTKMGSIIEKSMDDMVEALLTHDVELAQEVIDRDDVIDQMELRVEKDCILLIARQQPIATDLRDIAAVLKIITDLERIADQCANISKYVIQLSKEEYIKPVVHIPEMVQKVKDMVKDTIDSCVKKDLKLAQEIIEKDDEIDQYFHMIVDELIEIMQETPKYARQCTNFLFIIKYLERMGDHATNIAEWIIFTVTGKHI